MDYWFCVSVCLCVSVFSRERHNAQMLRASLSDMPGQLHLIPPSHRRRGATAVLVRHKPQWHRHDRRGSAVVPSLIVVAPRKTVKTAGLRGGTAATLNMFRRASAVLVPSHRRRGATAVLVRHKPQWHRHDRRGSAVVPSLIAVAPQKTIKTAALRGGTAETLNMFRRASAVLVPSHRRRGATAVLVRHKPQWHRHDRRGSAVVPSLIAVAPQKTVKTAALRGGTAETLNMFKISAVPPRVLPIRSGIAAAPP